MDDSATAAATVAVYMPQCSEASVIAAAVWRSEAAACSAAATLREQTRRETAALFVADPRVKVVVPRLSAIRPRTDTELRVLLRSRVAWSPAPHACAWVHAEHACAVPTHELVNEVPYCRPHQLCVMRERFTDLARAHVAGMRDAIAQHRKARRDAARERLRPRLRAIHAAQRRLKRREEKDALAARQAARAGLAAPPPSLLSASQCSHTKESV